MAAEADVVVALAADLTCGRRATISFTDGITTGLERPRTNPAFVDRVPPARARAASGDERGKFDAFQAWVGKAIGTVRELKLKLPLHSDLFRKDEAKERLHGDGLTQSTIVARLTSAAKAMEFVGK